MRVLAIEVATPHASVAVVGPDGTVSELAAHVPGAHLEWLIGAIDAVLAEARLDRRAVDGLAVSLGPGGFLGLRIGVATAAAWAHAAARPVVGISTLDVIASGAAEATDPGGARLVLAVTDARRGEVSAALFRRAAETPGIVRLTADLLTPPQALRTRLPALDEPLVVAGDGLGPHASAILAALAPWPTPAPEDRWRPSAAVLGALGRARLLRGERDDPWRLAPVYARGPEVRAFSP